MRGKTSRYNLLHRFPFSSRSPGPQLVPVKPAHMVLPRHRDVVSAGELVINCLGDVETLG